MSNQLTKNTNYLRILPCDVLSLIFEFEGSKKENYKKTLKEFKKILETKRHYILALKIPNSYCDDDDDNFNVSSIHYLNTKSICKFIINQKKFTSVCDCEEPCCYRFQYPNQKKYICGCHEKKEGGVVYSYTLGKKNKLSIRQEQTGFCVKITKPNYYNRDYYRNLLMATSVPVPSQPYNENAW